ncbi:GntR family transcriptional regulator [Nocardia farcinica]|nr:GntR family transcriptional regulator [Nocardia farcinica]
MDVDRAAVEPIRVQIARQLRSAIEAGLLPAGYVIPSSRNLAASLRVSRSTVVAALTELEGEGWIETSQGSKTLVSERPDRRSATSPATPQRSGAEAGDRVDMRPGDLNPDDIVQSGWRSAWRAVAPVSAPPPATGTSELRAALAAYLGASRGLPCDAQQIVVCAGTAEAMTVLTFAFGWSDRCVLVEDPGYPAIRTALEVLGTRCEPVDVADPAALLQNVRAVGVSAAAFYLTPSHQYPLGHRIDERTRGELLAWSRETDTVLIEDDYDSEFRFGVAPLPSLAGIDPNSNTIYVGTMSKVLDPGLRLTFLRVPPHLLDAVVHVRKALGSTVSAQVQQAVTHLLRSGELARHIARIRKIYADRRRVLLDELDHLPAVREIRGLDAGLHVVVELDQRVSAAEVVAQAGAIGIAIADLDEFRMSSTGRPALVLGYGRLPPAVLRSAVRRLAALPALRCSGVRPIT